jgi:muramoyltetrapeptide carboxypeptidase
MPPFLIPGQKVSVVATSAAIHAAQLDRLHAGVKIWRDRGYQVYVPEFHHSDYLAGYLAGSDSQRRQQLLTAWQDPETMAILIARGGYGATRLLEDWRWQNLPDKWLIGFSDITALLWDMASQGLSGGVHAPVLVTLSEQPEWVICQMFDLLEGKIKQIKLQGKGWGSGNARGRLLPGNLNLATHLIGTSLIPNWQDIILALEDIAEPPYKVDRMLTQWRMSSLLNQVKGIALGRFSFDSKAQSNGDLIQNDLTIKEVLRDRLADLNIPIVSELPFGHLGENALLPVGCNAQIDGDSGELSLNYLP